MKNGPMFLVHPLHRFWAFLITWPSLAFLSPSRLRAGLAAITWGDHRAKPQETNHFTVADEHFELVNVWLSATTS